MTILVTVLLSLGLLGLGAVALDVGSWYAEKAQVQNGSDAAALAVAQSCGAGACDVSLAAKYANNNANDGSTATPVVCGNATGSSPGLPACGSECQSGTGNYVDVGAASNPAMPAILGGAIPGNGGGSQTIRACSQATWGPPETCGSCVAFTVSDCEWKQNTNNGTQFATPWTAANPVYPPSYLATINARRANSLYNLGGQNQYVANNITDPHSPTLNAPIAGSETVLTLGGFGGDSLCGAHNGLDSPGHFGWLSKTSCTISLNADGTYSGSTGKVPAPCESQFQNSRTNQTPIYIPIFGSIDASGNYVLEGFAAFVVTGWNGLKQSGAFSTDTLESIITDNDTLLPSNKRTTDAQYVTKWVPASKQNDQSVYGYFTKALIPASDLPSGSGGFSFGAPAVSLTG